MVKFEKTVTVVRKWGDKSHTNYKVSVVDGDIHIEIGAGNMWIYFPPHITEALVSAIREVSQSIPLPDVPKDAP